MFLLAYKNVKKISKNMEIPSMVEMMWIFQPEKLHREKYVEKTLIFRPAKLHRKEYLEITWIFRPVKLCRKKCVEIRRNLVFDLSM